MNDSEFRYVDDPSVALRDDGVVGIVWVDNEAKDVFFRSYGADGSAKLSAPVNVSRSPRIFSWLPRLVMTRSDDVFVLWQEIVFSGGSHGGDIFFSRSHDGGTSFSEPLNLSNSVGGDGKGRLTEKHWDNGSLDLVSGGKSELFATWTEYDGALWFSRSSDAGQSFSEPLQVAGSSEQPARAPALAATDSGLLYLAWTVGEDLAADIRFAISLNHGETFGPLRTVATSKGRADAPKLALDGKGVLHLVYAQSAADPFEPSHVRYTRLLDSEGSFEEPRNISAARSKSSVASFPSLGVTATGHVAVVWQHHPSARQAGRGLGFVLSQDAGQTFTSPSVVPGSADPAGGVNGSRQGKLMSLLATNTGSLAVVNSWFRRGTESRVQLIQGQFQDP